MKVEYFKDGKLKTTHIAPAKPTLLEWLKSQSEASLKIHTGKDNVFPLMRDLKLYGLNAFNALLTPKEQHYAVSQYVDIFKG
jgi:hypothetical protein